MKFWSRSEERQHNNREILAGVGSETANQKHIFARLKQRFENNKLVALALKRIRQDRQQALTNTELYLDDWAYQNGPITKENLPIATIDTIDRVLTLHQAKQQQREMREERELSGSLMDGFDGVLGVLPGDSEIEDALIKADPTLEKYKR
jgi:hypothetical protein